MTTEFPKVEVVSAAAPDLWTAHVRVAEGQRIALHSTRAPVVEAQRQLEAAATGTFDTPPSVVALVGAGLGFVTEAARARWPGARLVIFEPSSELARHARARTPDLYASDRVRLLSGPDYASDQPLWQLLDQGKGPEPVIIAHPVIARLAPEAAAMAEASARRAIQAAQMNARARQENAGRYLLNTLRNLAVTVHGFDVTALYGRLTGVPIVIVAAGPSLDRQLPALRSIADRAMIVAADTAWRPLAAAGIDPHIVVALDPTEMNGQHLLNVPARRRPWLIAEPSIDPRVFTSSGSRTAAFRVAHHHPWPWLGTLGIAAPVVRVWGSVITACTDLALSFGGDPLIFAGADLAFTGGQPYCRGTTFERDWARVAAMGWSLREAWDNVLASRPIVTAPALEGGETRTAPYLIEFRDWLVARTVEQPNRRFVNTTSAGILSGGSIRHADLASIARDMPPRGVGLEEMLNAAWARPAADATLVGTVRDALKELEREAAARAHGSRDGVAPTLLADWLDFGGPRLTLPAVHEALQHAAGTLDGASIASAHPAAVRPSPLPEHERRESAGGLRLHEADRVIQMRAWLEADPAEGDRPKPAGVDAALARLLSVKPPLAEGLAPHIPGADVRELVPLSYRFAWAPEVTPLVASLEETLLDARQGNSPQGLAPGERRSSFWRKGDVPAFGPDEEAASIANAAMTGDGLDAAARGSVIATTLGLMTVSGALAPRWRRLCHAAARGLADPRQHRTMPASYRLRWRDWPVELPIRIDALMRALTGTLSPLAGFPLRLAPAGHTLPLIVEPLRAEPLAVESASSGATEAGADSGELRSIFLRADTVHVEPDVMTDRGFPTGWACETLDDRHAIVTPGVGRHAIRVDAAGHTAARASWPDDINNDVPWGPAGGAIAWNTARADVFFRATADGSVSRTSLPFLPWDMTLGGETTWWAGAEGGIWEWLPGHEPRAIAQTPVGGGLTFDRTHLILHPFEFDSSRALVRRRQPYAWRYDIANGGGERIAVAAGGQCVKTRTRDPWTVRSYPFAGYLTFTHRDGRVLALACHAPVGIAWAGTSLIVTTLDADVLLFRDLWLTLSEAF